MLYVLTSNYFESGGCLIGVFDTYDLAYEAMEEFIYAKFDNVSIDEMWEGYWRVINNDEDWPTDFYIESCYPNTSLC